MNPYDLFIFAGEQSGDLHGEKLLQDLLKIHPHLRICGVGGPRMRALGMHSVIPMEEFQVMGFVDVFMALPKLIRQFYQVERAILEANPKAVLFIDYPGFNLRMAASLRKKKFAGKLCHYICPSVWAWGKKRIPHMAKTLDLLLTILPFEADFFSHTSLNVQYVGHPLMQRLQEYAYHPFVTDKRVIGIFPGSRKKELLRNLPFHLRTARDLLSSYPDLLFAVSISDAKFLPFIQESIRKEHLNDHVLLVESKHNYNLMKSCELAIAKSGTITLELALHQVPTVVTYGISPLDLFIVKDLLRIRLPHYCIVNIISQAEVFPELIGPHLTEESLYSAAWRFLTDPQAKQLCKDKCEELKHLLHSPQQAASTLLQVF